MCAVVITGSSTRSPECITAVMVLPSCATAGAGDSMVAARKAPAVKAPARSRLRVGRLLGIRASSMEAPPCCDWSLWQQTSVIPLNAAPGDAASRYEAESGSHIPSFLSHEGVPGKLYTESGQEGGCVDQYLSHRPRSLAPLKSTVTRTPVASPSSDERGR